MQKCHLCSNPATVHVTKVVNKTVAEYHLCEHCAAKQQMQTIGELSLSAILQSLIGQHLGSQAEELSRLTCPTCGIKYMEFRGEGRLGCPDDYALFRAGLEPILQRVHRATRHTGKIPRRLRPTSSDRELLTLRQNLRRAVDSEAYEEAARLRDLIRQKEASDAIG